MKNLKHLGILCTIFVFTSCNGFSQYTGPQSKITLTTVKEVISNASQLDKSDQLVKLKGHVIEQIKSDEFWFQDETGKLIIEIEKKYFPDFEFNEKTTLIIIGEVDYDELEETEIEVESISIFK